MLHAAACHAHVSNDDISLDTCHTRVRFRESQNDCPWENTNVWMGFATLDKTRCDCKPDQSEAACQACRARFSWLEGPVQTPNYTNWVGDEPSNDEHCVRITGNQGKWAGSNCVTEMKSVCEIGMYSDVVTTIQIFTRLDFKIYL